MSNFTDIEDQLTSEDMEGASADYFEPEGRAPLAPGRYLSRMRTLEQGKTSKGKACIKVTFPKEAFTTLKGEPIKGFPPFETLYFHKQKAFDGTGEISAVSKYLRACKLKFQDWAKGQLSELLSESESIPVVVVVGWEQDFKEVKEGEKAKKTSFFKDPATGKYLHQRKDSEGNVVTARARVVGYEVYRG